jgi:hypothetical protein
LKIRMKTDSEQLLKETCQILDQMETDTLAYPELRTQLANAMFYRIMIQSLFNEKLDKPSSDSDQIKKHEFLESLIREKTHTEQFYKETLGAI